MESNHIETICQPVVQPIPETVAQPISESVPETVPEPVSQSIFELATPVIEPIVEPIPETVAEPIPETVAEPVSEPITDPVSEPIVEPVPQAVSEPISEPVSEPIAEPVSEPITEPIAEPVVEPVTEPVEPVAEVVAEPVVEPVAEVVTEPVSEPIVEPIVEPVEPVAEVVTEPVVEPVSEPIVEPIVEPVAEPISEPVTEPIVEPIEPVSEEIAENGIEIVENSKWTKGLFIGCNYSGDIQLQGCINDALNAAERFSCDGLSVKNIRLLIDETESAILDSLRAKGVFVDTPTRANIMTALSWLSHEPENQNIIFTFSGHGTGQKDEDGDEDDGMDECICPCDVETEGLITDDEIRQVLVDPLHESSTLAALIDCCHSGTVLDLPFVFPAPKPSLQQKIVEALQNSFLWTWMVPSLVKNLTAKFTPKLLSTFLFGKAKKSFTKARVFCISGCADKETASECNESTDQIFHKIFGGMVVPSRIRIRHQGAMSWAFWSTLEDWKRRGETPSWKHFVLTLRKKLSLAGFRQSVQLTVGKRALDVDAEVPF
jgi:hypothetical protein